MLGWSFHHCNAVLFHCNSKSNVNTNNDSFIKALLCSYVCTINNANFYSIADTDRQSNATTNNHAYNVRALFCAYVVSAINDADFYSIVDSDHTKTKCQSNTHTNYVYTYTFSCSDVSTKVVEAFNADAHLI